MNGKTESTCITPEMLTNYLTGKLGEIEEILIEKHLAACNACTEDARVFHDVQMVWSTWTARAHGEAYWRMRLEDAVAAAERAAPSEAWRERLSVWKGRFMAAADAVARVVLEESTRASLVVTKGLEALVRPGAAWTFAPAGAVRTRGSVGTRGPASPITARTAGRTTARIVVSPDGRQIEVGFHAVPPGQASPLLLLIPVADGAAPRVAEAQQHHGAGVWRARFEGLEPGEYLVVVEPTA